MYNIVTRSRKTNKIKKEVKTVKELKTITEYQLLYLAYHALTERIVHEEEINERTKRVWQR